MSTRGTFNRGRGRYSPGYQRPQYQNQNQNHNQSQNQDVMTLLQNILQPQAGPSGGTRSSLNQLNILAQKRTSRCSRCGQIGHWYKDNACRPEDIAAHEQRRAESGRVAALSLVPGTNTPKRNE